MAKTFTAQTIANQEDRYFEAELIEEMSGKCFMRIKAWDHSGNDSKLIGIFTIPATSAGRAKYEDLKDAMSGRSIT